MSIQESKDHKHGLELAEALGIKKLKGRNLYNTSWGIKTPIGLVRTIRNIIKEK